jgi:hypothetical protein
MLTSRARPAAATLAAMDFAGRILVVLGFVAGAVTGAMAVAAPLVVLAGVDVTTLAAEVPLALGAAAGAVIGARVNRASARTLEVERAADATSAAAS